MKHCPYCQSDKSDFLWTAKATNHTMHSYYKCKLCKTVFLYPQPDTEDANSMYDEVYYGAEENEKFSSNAITKVIEIFSRHRARRFLKQLPPKPKIMDFGCGNGRFLEQISRKNKQASLHGLEINTKAALRAKNRLEGAAWLHTVADISKHFPASSFDGVSCIHVLEHLKEPKLQLDRFYDILKTDGILLLVIPNINSFQAKIFQSDWFHLDPPRHLNFIKPGVLIKELTDKGFTMISKRTFDTEQNPYGCIQSLLNVFTKQRDVLFEHLKGNKMSGYKKLHIYLMKLVWLLMFPFALLGDIFASLFSKGACIEMIFRKTGT